MQIWSLMQKLLFSLSFQIFGRSVTQISYKPQKSLLTYLNNTLRDIWMPINWGGTWVELLASLSQTAKFIHNPVINFWILAGRYYVQLVWSWQTTRFPNPNGSSKISKDLPAITRKLLVQDKLYFWWLQIKTWWNHHLILFLILNLIIKGRDFKPWGAVARGDYNA